MNWRVKGMMLALAATLLTGLAAGPLPVRAVGSGTVQVMLTADKPDVTVNGDAAAAWDAVPVAIGDQVYVPLKPFADTLGLKVGWNEKTKRVELTVPKVKVQFDIDHNEIWLNQVRSDLSAVAVMKDGRLMVRLSWVAGLIGAKYSFDPVSGEIVVTYTQRPDDLVNDENDNSRPVAKFTFGKPSYRIGEQVKFIDLSYDPDAEGLPKMEWYGRKDFYEKAGTYTISLKVTDSSGHVSAVYKRDLVITNEVYVTPLEAKLHYTPEGSAFKTDWSELYGNFLNLDPVPKTVLEEKDPRTLVVSDSPETMKEKGILYQETVSGKARLYADHVNGMDSKVQFVIMARNPSPDKTVTIKTTNKGEVYPSIHANLIGHEASVDFMLQDPVSDKPLKLPPGQGFTYVRMPDFYPGQGVNVFYDVETDGPVEFSFIAIDNDISTPMPSLLGFLKRLPFNGNVRGTFPSSDIGWKADLSGLTKPMRITIGDGKEDPFIKGKDQQGKDTGREGDVYNEGNYGMVYHMELDNPPMMDILLLARGGPFKGPFLINGEFAMAPHSGVLESFLSLHVLKRTTGKEGKLVIEFTPPAGSAFPVDLIFYPLKELK